MWKFHPEETWYVPEYIRELVEKLTKPLPVIFQQSWLTKVVTGNWRVASIMLICRKGQKYNVGSYRPVSLTLVLGKLMEILLSTHHMARTGDPGAQALPAWVCERHNCPIQSPSVTR